MRLALLTFILQTAAICAAFGNHLNNGTPSQQGDLHKAQQFLKNQHAAFEENKGQVTGEDAEKVKFTYKDKGLSIFLLNNGIAYQFSKTHYPADYVQLDKFTNPEERAKIDALRKDIRTETYRMDIRLIGANPQPHITTEGKSNDYTHYYNHDALEVYHYSKVTYHNVYPHIDWVLYSKNGQVKYDFVVHPGGNPAHIKLQTQWVEDLTLNADGSLSLHNRMGSITEQKPISFQGNKTINTQFNLVNNQIIFSVDPYDPSQTLIIDPALQWATYYGGNSFDVGNSCATDQAGNVYLAGQSSSSLSIAAGGHQNTIGGTADAFLAKFNSGGVRQWATYYGGLDLDGGSSCAVSLSGDVYLCGSTFNSSSIAFGGHQNTFGGGVNDAFLVKFNSSGVRQWGTYYGGLGDDSGNSCAVDASGNVYLAGSTASITNIASEGHQNDLGGNFDAFLVKFNSSGIRQWGTYYGGVSQDLARTCAVDNVGNIYLAGFTQSSSAIASGGHQNTYGGSEDAFLVKFNSSGVRQWGTYYGGSSGDGAEFCITDASNNVYLTGTTNSTSSIAFGGHQNTFGGVADAYLVKFSGDGVRQWGTYYGGLESDAGFSGALDAFGNVFVVGLTTSNSSIAFGGYQNTFGGGDDAFLVKFNNSGVRQWATYYGGNDIDRGLGCTADASGNVYIAGVTLSSSSSIASGGHQNTIGGDGDGFLAKFNDEPACVPTISITSNQSGAICQGTSIEFTATITDGGTNPTYQWQRNGNNVGTNSNTFTSSENTNGDVITCILSSNATCASPTQVTSEGITLTVNPTLTPSLSISANASTVCEGSSITFTATVTNGGTNPTYQWQRNGSNVGINSNTYTSSDNTNGDVIACILTSNATCASPTQVTSEGITLTVNPTLTPSISISANASTVCEGSSITFTATVTNGGTNPTYQWQRNGSNVGTNSNTYTSSDNTNGDVITCILTSNAPCATLTQVTSEEITLTVNPLPALSITVIGESLEATAGYSSYTWYLDEVEITGATDNILEPLEDGTYEVEVTDENGCTNTAAVDFVINSTSEPSFLSDIALYPNPSDGNFTITLRDGAPRNMQVFDGYGKMVFQTTINGSKEQINLQGLAQGVYYVKIMEGDGYKVKSLLIFN
jgi:hypothetical protein